MYCVGMTWHVVKEANDVDTRVNIGSDHAVRGRHRDRGVVAVLERMNGRAT